MHARADIEGTPMIETPDDGRDGGVHPALLVGESEANYVLEKSLSLMYSNRTDALRNTFLIE